MKILFRLITSLAVIGGIASLVIMWREDDFIYYPEREWAVRPEHYGLAAQDLYVQTQDLENLHAWFIRAPSEKAALLFFHGNAGNISHRIGKISPLIAAGASVLLLDYRGYGKSSGHPSEEGLYRDAEAAYQELTVRQKIEPSKIFLFGESIGGAVAIDLAAQHPCAGVILEGTFSSVKDMAAILMPFLPMHFILKSKYDSISKIVGIKSPLLFIHGTDDEIVPYSQGQKLFAAATSPKEFYSIPGAGHNDTYVRAGKTYFEKIIRFIEKNLK